MRKEEFLMRRLSSVVHIRVFLVIACGLISSFASGEVAPEIGNMKVTPNYSGATSSTIGLQSSGFTASNISVQSLIAYAYGTKRYALVGAPEWTSSARFDVQVSELTQPARFLSSAELQEHRKLLVQAVLANIFHFQSHKLSKRVMGYALVVSSNVPRMTTHDPLTYAAPRIINKDGNISMTALPVTSLAEELSDTIGVKVIDQTGLNGNYDLSLSWGDSGSNRNHELVAEALSSALLHQLGLSLVPQEVDEENLVIDSISSTGAR